MNVSNGVSRAFHKEVTPLKLVKPYLFGIASAKRHKNLRGLLRAFAASRSSREFDLRLLGDKDSVSAAMVESLGVGDCVRFLGHLSDADLATVYSGATAFVFVSHYEGFGLPIVEAMACGTPVITSAAASMPEIAGGAAILVDPAAIEEISEAIDRLCSSLELRTNLRRLGLHRASVFSWDDTARRVVQTLAPFL